MIFTMHVLILDNVLAPEYINIKSSYNSLIKKPNLENVQNIQIHILQKIYK